jgi:hypothetical protein
MENDVHYNRFKFDMVYCIPEIGGIYFDVLKNHIEYCLSFFVGNCFLNIYISIKFFNLK